MAETVQQTVAKKSVGKSKRLLVIAAVVLVQLVAAYFLIGFFFNQGGADSHAAGTKRAKAGKMAAENSNFDNVFIIKDLIVNPAGTNGLRFLLTTIGLEVSSKQTEQECEKRNVEIHDAIINVLTSKTLPQLDDANGREKLKTQIKTAINRDLETGSVLNVYFSKFIIQ